MMVVEPPSYAAVVRSVARVEADHSEREAAQAEVDALAGVEGHVALGLAGEELAAFGSQVDLLVVGSRGYGPIRRLIFGSTSGHLAGNARCPLVVLPRLGDGDDEVAVSGAGSGEATT
jgi:nucleotide-binding universal stress UspA family protein